MVVPFFLFSKHITSSLKITCSGLPLPSSSVFTFTLFSRLSSSSSSSHSIPPHTPIQYNVISEFLLNECGLCPSQLTKVMTARPSLLRTASPDAARKVVLFLRDLGFSENQLHKTIVRNPSILSLNVDGQVRLKMEFMKRLGFTHQGLVKLIYYRPRLLNSSLENSIRPKILYLENLFGSKVHLLAALRLAPALLLRDIEKQLKPKVEYIKNNFGILEGSKRYPDALCTFVCNGPENVEKKMKHIENLGFVEDEVHQVLKKFPAVLNVSMNKLQRNMYFLTSVAGLQPKDLVLNPVILSFSLEKRLKPRYEIYKSLSTKPHSKGLPSLVTIFKQTEKRFLTKFAQSDPQGKPPDGTVTSSILQQ